MAARPPPPPPPGRGRGRGRGRGLSVESLPTSGATIPSINNQSQQKKLPVPQSKEDARQLAKSLLQEGDYRRAATVICGKFNLREEFTVVSIIDWFLPVHFKVVIFQEEVAIPLILCNLSGRELEDVLKGSPRLQLSLVNWMDDLDLYSLGETNRNYPLIKQKCTNRLVGKPLGRFIEALVSKFGLNPEEAAPKHYYNKKWNDLRYHVGEKGSSKMREFALKILLLNWINRDSFSM